MEGLHGRCPHCAATFTIPEKQGAFRRKEMVAADEDDEPRTRYRDEERPVRRLSPGWIGVRNGLLLVRISTIIMIFVFLGMILFFALASGMVPLLERNRNAEMVLGSLLIMAGLVALAAAILALVGQCMCCAVPDSGPKGLAISSVVCLVLTLFLVAGAILATIVQEQRDPFGMHRTNLRGLIAGLNILGLILGTVGHFLFGFFLKGVANYFDNQSLSKSTGIYLILVGVFVICSVLSLLVLIVLGAAPRPNLEMIRILSLLMGVGLLVFALVLVLWFLDILGKARATITRALQEGW
jgi:hypothetical protein